MRLFEDFIDQFLANLRVVRFIGSVALEVLKAFAEDTQRKHEDEWCDGTVGFEGRDEGYTLEDGTSEEVDVGVASKLKKEG